jgi:hypothetical protein
LEAATTTGATSFAFAAFVFAAFAFVAALFCFEQADWTRASDSKSAAIAKIDFFMAETCGVC